MSLVEISSIAKKYTFNLLQDTFTNIQIRFSLIIYNYDAPSNKLLLTSFIENIQNLYLISDYIYQNNLYGVELSYQVKIIRDGCQSMKDYIKTFFKIVPTTYNL